MTKENKHNHSWHSGRLKDFQGNYSLCNYIIPRINAGSPCLIYKPGSFNTKAYIIGAKMDPRKYGNFC